MIDLKEAVTRFGYLQGLLSTGSNHINPQALWRLWAFCVVRWRAPEGSGRSSLSVLSESEEPDEIRFPVKR